MPSKRKILVVEDNPINRLMLCGILASEYEVLEAENGQLAFDILERSKEDISLILLDVMMPVMDGHAFLNKMKEDTRYASIPVIVTTQNESEADEITALSHGAADFVVKPYKPKIIRHRVASIINLRETAAMVNLIQYDRLTGIYSKEFFYQKVREVLLANPDKQYDIICSDIEKFKLINDIFGVPAGNQLLCQVAKQCREFSGELGICGRFEADRFACLLEHTYQYTDDVFAKAEARINAMSPGKNVVMKWGVYPISDRLPTVEQMCDRAFLAVQSIKGQYGQHMAYYGDELRRKMLWERVVTDGMEVALEESQFEVYLQPKYRICDKSLIGAEALVRWNHPEWGIQPPAQFIPLFEKNGFITKMDQFVWNRAGEILQEWREKGYPLIPLSVNVSRADIYHTNLSDILLEIVKKYNIPISAFHLEITESAYTEDPKQIIDTVGYLRTLGFVVEMDDFGTGYSSLHMLSEMPVDILKLDMKFIQSETAKPVSQGILQFIMSLARWMNLSVVAEGVEKEEQLEHLRKIGCDCVQGYYFAKPMPVSEFNKLLEQKKLSADTKDLPEELIRKEEQQPVLLVIDEDAAYCKAVQKTFGSRYKVVDSPDSNTALTAIAFFQSRIIAVILSMTLPKDEGNQVLEVLMREKPYWKIPVIVTGKADAELEKKVLKAGADDFAVKPHLQESLDLRLQHVIRHDFEREG